MSNIHCLKICLNLRLCNSAQFPLIFKCKDNYFSATICTKLLFFCYKTICQHYFCARHKDCDSNAELELSLVISFVAQLVKHLFIPYRTLFVYNPAPFVEIFYHIDCTVTSYFFILFFGMILLCDYGLLRHLANK